MRPIAGRTLLDSYLLPQLMAQHTVSRGISFLVTIHAGLHFHRNCRAQHVSLWDRAVAHGTLHAGLRVAGMTEKYKPRKLVDPHPSDGIAPLRQLGQLANRRTLSFDAEMTKHALAGSRETGTLVVQGSGVTIQALESDGGMALVVEGYGLRNRFRLIGRLRGRLVLCRLAQCKQTERES